MKSSAAATLLSGEQRLMGQCVMPLSGPENTLQTHLSPQSSAKLSATNKHQPTARKSMQLRTLRIPLVLLATLALTSCASARHTVITPPVCSDRIPPRIRADVPPADLPSNNEIGEWVAFGDAQTGNLEAANDRKNTALWIVGQCEREYQATVERLNRRWFEFWK